MAFSFLPSRQTDIGVWMENFRDLINADPAKYGLTAANAAAIDSDVTDFVNKLALVQVPATKTKATVAAKVDALTAATATVRLFAGLIRSNPGVNSDDKVALGLKQDVGVEGGPSGPPSTQPVLVIVGATPLSHTLRYADASTPLKRAKPNGVLGLHLYVALGTAPTSDPNAADFYGQVNVQPVGTNFDPADRGKYATYFGQWVNRKGEVGPWSDGVTMIVA
jgi:hypothetical protein